MISIQKIIICEIRASIRWILRGGIEIRGGIEGGGDGGKGNLPYLGGVRGRRNRYTSHLKLGFGDRVHREGEEGRERESKVGRKIWKNNCVKKVGMFFGWFRTSGSIKIKHLCAFLKEIDILLIL